MASPEVSTRPSVKPKTARKRKKAAVAAKPVHTADVEAIGLILFGLAVVVGLTVFAPSSLKLFSAWQNALRGVLGWGMYYLPFPFLVFGGLIFIKTQSRFGSKGAAWGLCDDCGGLARYCIF